MYHNYDQKQVTTNHTYNYTNSSVTSNVAPPAENGTWAPPVTQFSAKFYVGHYVSFEYV